MRPILEVKITGSLMHQLLGVFIIIVIVVIIIVVVIVVLNKN